ncbi:MAG: FkbM family methyltransferase [Microcoleaceae cyanobacterium]
MGLVRWGPPTKIVDIFKENYHLKNFIETGTYHGETAWWASQRFQRVITIERSEIIYKHVQAKYSHIENIEFLEGDTRSQLDRIVPSLNSPSLFWLDAHWSGGETYGEGDECPLLKEIEIINRSNCEHFIFIDDARFFTSPPVKPHKIEHWPDLTTVLNLLNSSASERYIVILDDVIIAVPHQAKQILAQYCQQENTKEWLVYCQQQQNDQSGIEVAELPPKSAEVSVTSGYLDLKKLCQQYSIIPQGIIHIGAHEGQELQEYQDMGANKILFIEANPSIFQRLKRKISDSSNVFAVNCAVSNHNGETILRVNAHDMSSSILPLKRHKDIYPGMLEVEQVTVTSRKLDSLLLENKFDPADFNIITVDIQGAELLAFQGATETLPYIEAICTEVNYEELYEGCALIDQLDHFLGQYGFERVAISIPSHPSWGDAFYVKKSYSDLNVSPVRVKSFSLSDSPDIKIITSIAPENLEKQRVAISTWKKLGFSVISLNSALEIEKLEPHYADITLQIVSRDAQAEVGKPLIYLDDMFCYFQDHPSKICAVVNSDIQLQADENFSKWVLKEAEDAIIFGSRIEIETLEQRQGELYNKGFDFFFFDSKYLKDFPPSKFCLGLPWWDFYLPLMALQQGWTLKHLVTPVAYHLKHSVNYNNQNWQKYGIEFTKFFNIQLSQSLQQLQLTHSNQLQKQLIQVANHFLEEVHQKSVPVEYQTKIIDTQSVSTCLSPSLWKSLEILPINFNLKRPFWSVMIPTFNKVKYLEQTLKSVLSQAPHECEMQIEVVNDHPDPAIQSELENIVQKVGAGRIKFYRHSSQDIGQTAIFNLCLNRAQGHWIHLLHDDDWVLPGFYQALERVISQGPNVGAAFCRHYYIDEKNRQRSVSFLEQETSGILENWLEKIAISQRIQPSAIVVKRKVYEQLGGFNPEASSAADWEMWKRISVHCSIGYEPQPLACYRLHSISWTSRLIQTGENIADTRKAIEISQAYLPSEQSEFLSQQAREHYAIYAVNTAKQLLAQGEEKPAISQVQEALKCSHSAQVKQAVIQLFDRSVEQEETHRQKPEQTALKQPEVLEPAILLSEVSRNTERYRQDAGNVQGIERLRQLRQAIAQFWLNTPLQHLQQAYVAEVGQAHQLLSNSGLKNEPLTKAEQISVNQSLSYLSQGMNQANALQHLLAVILYIYPHQFHSQWYQKAPIPKWFVPDYLQFMLSAPDFFQNVGEVQQYYQYFKNWVGYLHGRIFSDPDSKIWQEIANIFSKRANFIPLYFNTENLKDLYIQRADILQLALNSQGYSPEYSFPDRSQDRTKIRLGILSSHFNPQTETYATLPVFEYLDHNQFEIILYASNVNGHILEQYCQNCSDRLVKLPQNLSEQVKTIRTDDLDILLIATNVTAVTHGITLLALHRLARIQVASTPSCVTTGIKNIDYYISGNLTEPPEIAPSQYREQLLTLAGPAHCFSFAQIDELAKVNPQRSDLGINQQTIVFISGANFYKIIPELRETWAKILAQVPNSRLVLYPFNPNWTSRYAKVPFIKNLNQAFAKHGIEQSRLIILDTQSSRADIKEYLKLADVYLDSFPFSGVTSLVDPLEIGLVPVTKDGHSFRSSMGAALLRSLSLPELITDTEESYIQLAIQLAKDQQKRDQFQEEIRQKMGRNPSFLDSRAYSEKIGVAFRTLFQTWQQNHKRSTSFALNTPGEWQSFLTELVNAVNLYDLDNSQQTVVDQLRQLRRAMADFWLRIPTQQLELFYQRDMGKGYQILLNRGIQRESLADVESQFVDQLTRIATGLLQPNSLNCLMAAMLYYVPGKMLVRDAEKRLPSWLLTDYQKVFESQSIVQGIQQQEIQKTSTQFSQSETRAETIAETITDSSTPKVQVLKGSKPTAQAFYNRLAGCLNLYDIDPSEQSVLQDLRHLRHRLAEFWVNAAESELESLYYGIVGEEQQLLLKSQLIQEPLTEVEQKFLQQLVRQLNQGLNTPRSINSLLAVMLYCHPKQLNIQDIKQLPIWLQTSYQQFTNQVEN